MSRPVFQWFPQAKLLRMDPEVLHTLAPTISPLQLPTSPPTIQGLRGVSDSPFREQASAFGDISAFEPTMPPPHSSYSPPWHLFLHTNSSSFSSAISDCISLVKPSPVPPVMSHFPFSVPKHFYEYSIAPLYLIYYLFTYLLYYMHLFNTEYPASPTCGGAQ